MIRLDIERPDGRRAAHFMPETAPVRLAASGETVAANQLLGNERIVLDGETVLVLLARREEVS